MDGRPDAALLVARRGLDRATVGQPGRRLGGASSSQVLSFERWEARAYVPGVFKRASFTTGVLLTVTLALATSATPACELFGECDPGDEAYCDGDTAHVCEQVCEMKGTPDEVCSDDWRWNTWDCDSEQFQPGSTCRVKNGYPSCERSPSKGQ